MTCMRRLIERYAFKIAAILKINSMNIYTTSIYVYILFAVSIKVCISSSMMMRDSVVFGL